MPSRAPDGGVRSAVHRRRLRPAHRHQDDSRGPHGRGHQETKPPQTVKGRTRKLERAG